MSKGFGADGSIPADLIGEWTHGSVGGDLLDPMAWAPATSSAFLYRFAEDGTYEFAGRMTAAGTTVSSYEHGTVETSGDELTVRPAEVRVRRPDTSGIAATPEPQPRSYRWRVGRDRLGAVALVLTLPDGQEDVFHRR